MNLAFLVLTVLSLETSPPDGGIDASPASQADAGSSLPDGGESEVAPAPVPAAAPVVLVRGTVFARGSSDPVLGATIVVDAQALGETDEAGKFAVEVPAGRHHLQIQAPGFDLVELPIETTTGANFAPLTVRLAQRLIGERYQTVVSAPQGEAVALGGDDLTRTPGSLGEPFRVIESLPGVSQVAWPLALYAVRGANPGNTGFFVDGVRLPALFHLGLGPAVIHPYFLEQLDFFPGGYPAQYGRFVSGIVAATTAEPKPDRVRGSVDLRLYDAGAIIATPFHDGKGTVMVAGRYSFTGLLFSALSPAYTLSYWDYQARMDHTLGPGKLSVFAFGSHDSLGHKQYPETNADIDFHRLDLRWQGAVGPGRFLLATALGADRSAVTLDPLIRLPVRIANKSVAPRTSYTVIRDAYEVRVGADTEVQFFDPTTERADAQNQGLFKKRVAAASGAYASVTLRAGDRFELTPSMRYDVFYEGDTRRYEPGPRLRLRFRAFDQTAIKAQVGRFAQTASLPVAVPGFESFGLESFGTQTSKQGSLGIEQGIGDALALDVTSFYQRFKLTDLLNIFNIGYEDPRLLELREGEGYGVEVMLRRAQSHRAYGWISYTWSKSLRLVGPSGAKAYSDWDQRHVMNLVAGVRLPRGFNIGGRLHVNTGRPYPLFDEEGNAGPPDYIRLPTFFQADLRIEKRFVLDRYVLDVYLEAVNSTLSKQVFDVKRENGERVDKYYQIVLPSLGIHAEW